MALKMMTSPFWLFVICAAAAAAAFFTQIEGKPQIQNADGEYQYDDSSDYDYGNDNMEDQEEEEEEEEIKYDINFTNTGQTYTFDKGTTIRLPCNVDKYPKNFIIMWKKVSKSSAVAPIVVLGDKVYTDQGRISVDLHRQDNPERGSSTLVIGLAEDSDAGQYVCGLGQSGGKEIKHTVVIRDPPRITKTPSNGLQKAKKGDSVVLSCNGKGNPVPTITWTRVGKKNARWPYQH